MKIVFLFLIVLSLNLVNSFAQAETLVDLRNQLERELSKRIYSLDRELVTFRYEVKSQTQFEPQNTSDVIQRINGWSERFFNANVVTLDMVGPGTYLAVDPFASRSFGGREPQLYIITLKKTTKFLNLQSTKTELENILLKKAQEALQCRNEANVVMSDGELSVINFRQSKTQECRSFVISIFNDLKVQAIFYEYSASNSLSDCRPRSSAINVISSAAIDFNKISYFSDESKIDAANSASAVKALYYEASNDLLVLSRLSSDMLKPPKQLDSYPFMNQELYKQWKNEKIYSCGSVGSYESEDIFDSKLTQNMKLNYYDVKTKELALELIRTAKIKKGSQSQSNFSLSNVVKIAKLQLAVTNIAQSEENFKNYMKINSSDDEAANENEIKTMFGTNKLASDLNAQDSIIMESKLKNMSDFEANAPDMFFKLYEEVGIKGNYAIVLFNNTLVDRGYVIISSADPNKTILQNFEISKTNYQNVLNECIKLYSDKNLTFDEIQKTECAIKEQW